jgi:hypothetical protein
MLVCRLSESRAWTYILGRQQVPILLMVRTMISITVEQQWNNSGVVWCGVSVRERPDSIRRMLGVEEL